MNNPSDNLPPKTSKFFDIIPASKRSASPTSRPLIASTSPSQADSMITGATESHDGTEDKVVNDNVVQPDFIESSRRPADVS